MFPDLRIDLIAGRRWPPAGIALALAACLLLGWQGHRASADTDALTQVRTRLAQLQRQADQQRSVRVSPDALQRQQQVEALAAYLALPWGRLLGVFESHANGRAVLLRLEPNAAEGRVDIRGRAVSMAALSEYLLTLERDTQLSDVMLSRHEVVEGEGASGIDFTLSATWAASGHGAQHAGKVAGAARAQAPTDRARTPTAARAQGASR